MFRIILIVLFLLVLPAQTNAEIETQTAWGNPGIYGPLGVWGNTYYFSENLATYSSLTLEFGSINTIDPEIINPDEVQAGDIDGDGYTDVVAAGSGGLKWYANSDGTGENWTKHGISTNRYGIHDIKIGDINGDGYSDLVLCTSDVNVVWLENTDGSGLEWEEHLIAGAPGALTSAEIVDLNQNGYPDVVFATRFSGIRWMENLDGTGLSWQEHMIQDNYTSDCDMFAVDLDLDGLTDIISGNKNDLSVSCFRNLDNTGLNWEKVEICNSIPPQYIHFGFVNEDEFPDIFVVCYSYGGYESVSWFENPGSITPDWQGHTINDDFYWGISLHSADLNGNGYSDLLVTSHLMIYRFMNISGGAGWNQIPIDDCLSNYITSGNMGPDGNADAIYSKAEGDEVVWVNLFNYATSGYLESSVLQVASSPNWNSVNWNAVEPDSTVLGIQLRTSDNFPVMGLWTDTLYTPCSLEGILEPGDDYIQYRVVMSTSNLEVTPTLEDISISWEPMEGIGEEASADQIPLVLHPIPFSSNLSVEFTLREPSAVSLGIYDLNGRLIALIVKDTFTEGSFSLEWSAPVDFPNGCYLLQLETESGTFSRNCVHIR
ncbi:MAG: hypothetical protein B1H09_08005 [Gemmatimonadaceae bacterium 4484_173]|nr:MAG: hypothetical protein B1H09_08005 [Gemmatimonadaceae bacterium 4484_173]RKZ01974.1 MAG: hypothetical protein DRQ21_09565 [Candidatus Fermentibacteria bacterium]